MLPRTSMYTNQKLSKILSLLDNLSETDLMDLKNIIDYRISNNTNDQSLAITFVNTALNNPYQTTYSHVLCSELKETKSIKHADDIYKSITNLPNIPEISDETIKDILRSKAANLAKLSERKTRRPSAIWKGKVSMPDNFNDLSSDVISDFGMDE